MSRKTILFIDGGPESQRARKFLREAEIDFVEYNVKDQQEAGCCSGESFTTEAPSVFAPEGIFRGMSGIRKYANMMKERKKNKKKLEESESAFW